VRSSSCQPHHHPEITSLLLPQGMPLALLSRDDVMEILTVITACYFFNSIEFLLPLSESVLRYLCKVIKLK
jgi:hypothetical protein